jgi:hypothetical protein
MQIERIPHNVQLLEGTIFHYYTPDMVSPPLQNVATGVVDLLTGEPYMETLPLPESPSTNWTHVVIYELGDLRIIAETINGSDSFAVGLNVAQSELMKFKKPFLHIQNSQMYITVPRYTTCVDLAHSGIWCNGFCNNAIFDDLFDTQKQTCYVLYDNHQEYDSIPFYVNARLNLLGREAVLRLVDSLNIAICVLSKT